MILISFSAFSISQVRVGEWQNHSFHNNGRVVVVTNNDVFMTNATGILKVNKKTNEIEDFSKISGLSDVNVSSAAYCKKFDYLLFGYANGNIDIINGNKIFNINDIKKKSINADKSINAIVFCGDNAYLGCGFGIVVINLKKKEIKDTWLIGNMGSYIKINDMDIDSNGEYIYVATDEGIYKGNMNKYLNDFSNWEIITDNYFQTNNLDWISGKPFTKLRCFKDNLIVGYKNYNFSDSDTILFFHNNTWDRFPVTPNSLRDIDCNNDIILLSFYGRIKFYDKNFNYVKTLWYLVNSTAIENNNTIWIADNESGLVKHNINDETNIKYTIDGPESNNIFDLSSNEEYLYGVGGSRDNTFTPTWRNPYVYRYVNRKWTTTSRKNTPELSSVVDLVTVVSDPKDPSHFFCGSAKDGIVEFRKNNFYKIYNNENSTLDTDPNGWVRIGGAEFDKFGNLWVVNSFSNKLIHVFKPDGTWKSIDNTPMLNTSNSGKILITKDNIKWVIIPRGIGLFVFDDNNSIMLTNIKNADNETFNDIYSIAEDKDGYIWIGTSKGVVVCDNPKNVFNSTNNTLQIQQIKVPRQNNTSEADLLLVNEIVTAIVVDGANKKWFGTSSSGVFYTNYNGTEGIYNFNTENSPLMDNNILCMTVVPKTGEVFIGTSKGLQSFRNFATEGAENYGNVYAYPNPVEHKYDGLITITGLMANSYVKITDIAGNLVFEVKSEGGQAVWNGKDKQGNRVKTGIYLVFSTIESGEQTNVTKIMIIN